MLARAQEDSIQKPPQQKPEHPEFWDQRFRQGCTPWDNGGVPAQLAHFALKKNHPTHGLRTLIPGCGSAYEAAYLDKLGWPVTALDFSSAAIEAAGQHLGDYSGQLLCADFFNFPSPHAYEFIYERAFLCALPRKLWPEWSARVAELLAPGGLLAGYFFIDENALKGPPFGIAAAHLSELCKTHFELIDEQINEEAITPFAGKEHWMVWRRLK